MTEEEINSRQTILDQKLYSRNVKWFGMDLNPVVSFGALAVIALFAGFSLLDLAQADRVFTSVKNTIIEQFDWLFILSSTFFIGVLLFLALSKLGTVRLGGIGAKPEFKNFAWYSMLISAGMGIGLMFWAVGEPLYHANERPPIFADSNPTRQAMATTFFHWGLHPWAIYTLVSLALAYFTYNKHLPLSLRSVFYPLLKDKIFGFWGDLIDLLTAVACLFGLAASLGLGVQQINGGLHYLLGIDFNLTNQIILIIIITGIATLSVVSGIGKGVRILSEWNIRLAMIFMLIIFILGPTIFIIKTFSNGMGLYLNNFVKASFYISVRDQTWQGNWSVFFLAWWVAWSPFVGMFIARISKGRTIREFVLAVLIIPSLLSTVWLSVFGAGAIQMNNVMNGQLFTDVKNNLPVALFEMIHHLHIPFSENWAQTALSILATLLVASFFVTSSDSGSLVVDSITSGGKIDSPVPQRIFWACMEGFIAAILLFLGGEQALSALQTAVICTGLPLAILLIVVAIILVGSIRDTHKMQEQTRNNNRMEVFMENREQEEVIKELNTTKNGTMVSPEAR